MVDKSRLQVIGWVFGATTALVMMVAALLVTEAVASNHGTAPVATYASR